LKDIWYTGYKSKCAFVTKGKRLSISPWMASNSQRRKGCCAAAYARACHVADWLGRSTGHLRQIDHASVAEASNVCDDEGCKRGRSIRSSFSHFDRPDVDAPQGSLPLQKGLRASKAWKAGSSKGGNL
jgi:hypothetical protein